MKKVLVTGGAGFIGVNTCMKFAKNGWDITAFDNLSRPGADENVKLMLDQGSIKFVKGDIRNSLELDNLLNNNEFYAVIHLAAQVAVTTSVTDPVEDFEINAMGTFNVLESIRKYSPKTKLIFASTNKVYGKLEGIEVVESNGRYQYLDLPAGVNESHPLDFHSPYGCSKGCADQYVLDYARIYGLDTTSFRQSCIYGPRQFGIEDQGWLAWFIIASILGRQITIYGDGKQIRDVLHVDDLVNAYECALKSEGRATGHCFNIGGGPTATLSLLELVNMLESRMGKSVPLNFSTWRPGDQPVFVCDVSKAKSLLGWEPAIRPSEGVDKLISWVTDNQGLFAK